jgi:GAF domain-containing protein
MISNQPDDPFNSYILLLIEQARLQAIKEYELLDGEIDVKTHTSLNNILKVATMHSGRPIGFISVVSSEEVKIISQINFKNSNLNRDKSFCTWTIEQEDLFMVEDSLLDTRFCEIEMKKAEEDRIRFYAGFPLINPNGYKIGSICVCDTKPAKLTEDQREVLKLISKQVIEILELDKERRELIVSSNNAWVESNNKDQQISNMGFELLTSINYITQLAGTLNESTSVSTRNQALSMIKSSCEKALDTLNKNGG